MTDLCQHPAHTKPTTPLTGTTLCAGHTTQLRAALTTLPGLTRWVYTHLPPSSSQSDKVSGSRAPAAPLNLTCLVDIGSTWVLLHDWADNHSDPPLKLIAPPTKDNPQGIATISAWLLSHLHQALTQQWAGDYTAEITHHTRKLQNRYPTTENSRTLPLPCPQCNRLTLHWTPPAQQGWPTLIRCTLCHHIIPENLYNHYTRLYLDEAA